MSAVSAANNQTNDTNDKISLISSIIGSDYDASKVAISSNDNILTQNVSTIQYDPYQNTTVIVYGTDGTVKTIISDGNAGSVIAGMDAITTLASQTTTDAGVTGQSGNSGVTTTSASQAKTTKKTTSTLKKLQQQRKQQRNNKNNHNHQDNNNYNDNNCTKTYTGCHNVVWKAIILIIRFIRNP